MNDNTKTEKVSDSNIGKIKVNKDLGWTLGIAIAVTISWSTHKSILWCLLHGALNWLYIIYYWFTVVK